MESKTTNKTGFFETSPGNFSLLRLIVFMYFICCAIPINFILILAEIRILEINGFDTWETHLANAIYFILVNVTWIAPKHIAKIVEERGHLTNQLAKPKQDD